MRTPPLALAAGLAALAGCHGRPPGPPPAEARPAGDGSTPAEEFRVAHQSLADLRQRMQALTDRASRPWRVASEFPESVPLSKAISNARMEVARHAYAVAVADPGSATGADALFACLIESAELPPRRNQLLDLALRHHPDDPRLGGYLFAMMGDSPPADAADWVPALLDRVTAATASPAVRAAAQTARGKLMVASGDPATVAAGERLLRAVMTDYPAERIGRTKVSAWAAGVLAGRQRVGGTPARPAAQLAPVAVSLGGVPPTARLHQ